MWRGSFYSACKVPAPPFCWSEFIPLLYLYFCTSIYNQVVCAILCEFTWFYEILACKGFTQCWCWYFWLHGLSLLLLVLVFWRHSIIATIMVSSSMWRSKIGAPLSLSPLWTSPPLVWCLGVWESDAASHLGSDRTINISRSRVTQ